MDGNVNDETVITEKQINITVDIVRFVCSLIVVSIHCLFLEHSSIQKTIWSFAVPFFAITSGYYFNYTSKDSYLKLLKRMFILILLGDALGYLVMIHAQHQAGHVYMNWRYFFYDNISLGHLWYLAGIIICATIVFFTKRFIYNIWMFVFILVLNLFFDCLGIFGINLVEKYGNFYTFYLIRSMIIFPYFCCGTILRTYNVSHDIKKIYNVIGRIVLILFLIIRRYIHKMNPSIGAFYIPLFILIILYQFIQKNPCLISNDIRHAKRLRFSSMLIYIVHPVFIYFLQQFFNYTGLVLYFATVICSIFVSFFIFDLKLFYVRLIKKE